MHYLKRIILFLKNFDYTWCKAQFNTKHSIVVVDNCIVPVGHLSLLANHNY